MQRATHQAPDREAHRINLSWLLKLRAGAIVGQVVTILVVELGLRLHLPLAPLFAIIGVEVASNVGVVLVAPRLPEVREWMLGILMAADVLLLTGLLYFTGGQFNPFTFLYLVHIALAAVVLRAWWTWSLVALSLASFGALFLGDSGLAAEWFRHPDQHALHMQMHMQGMWIGFAVAAVFIVYFLTRIQRDLAKRDADLAQLRAQALRAERLAALATLAAGAAHELATPLSTIAVAANELERGLGRGVAGVDAIADAQLIRQEVERCRGILDQMAIDAGQSSGEGFAAISMRGLLDAALLGLPESNRVHSELDADAAGELRIPPRAVAQALRGVVKNALQASPLGSAVTVRVKRDTQCFRIAVEDSGPGMSAEVLARAGEPFFTTKEPGAGMGLGLFLTRVVLERIGGSLAIDSQPGTGTCAVLSVPAVAAYQVQGNHG